MQELSHVLTNLMTEERYNHEKAKILEERAMYQQGHPDPELPAQTTYNLTITELTWTNQLTISAPATYVFGRGRDLEDFKLSTASKFHFILQLRNDGNLTIQDMGSTNGTFVDSVLQLKPFVVYALPSKTAIIAGGATVEIVRQ